jgi:hypothetical protein
MEVMEAQFNKGKVRKTKCDFCHEEPENRILIEKPGSMIINGELIVSVRKEPLYICLNCLQFEAENI